MSPTPPTTDNHGLPLIPHVGDANASDYTDQWGAILNDNGWSVLDKRLIARDTESNRTNYTPYQNALFRATDSGAWYVGDGSTWSLANSTVSALTADSASLGSASLSGSLTTDSGTTIWDSSNAHVPLAQLEADSITVAGNNISLGGSSTLAHGDLTNISASDHHEWPVSNSNLNNSSITISGTTVSLGGSVSLGHGDLTNTSISASDHHEWPITNSNLKHSSVTISGNSVSLGGSTSIAHADLTSVSNNDHHEWPVSNSNLSNSSITVAGTSVALGGSVSLGHGDLTSTSISASNHHEWPVSNSNLSNSSVTVGGNTVSLGGSTSIDHADLSSIGANDHHTAHEHPGDQAATSNINVNGNGITNVATINGTYAKHDFTGSTYNIDLVDSTADARFRNTAGDTIIWFRESRNVDVPNGQLSEQNNRVATRTWINGEISAGASSLSGLDTAVSTLQSNKLDSSAYTPESDTHSKTTSASALTDVSADSVSNAHHSRYTDSEASSAAPVQSVNNSTGDVQVPPTVNRVQTGTVLLDSTGSVTVSGLPFEPNEIQFHAEAFTTAPDMEDGSGNGVDSYMGSSVGHARADGGSITQQVAHSGGSGDSINTTSHYTSSSHCVAIRYANSNGDNIGFTRAALTAFTSDGFTLDVDAHTESVLVTYTAYRTAAITENLSELSHTTLVDVSSDDHHSKTTSASELTDVSADSDASAHHSKTTSASDLTDVSADSVSDAHHSRYSDSEARSAVDSDVDNAASSVSALDDAVAGKLDSADYNPESDTHSKTTSASELTDVSPDSNASAHHSRYADSEAVSAVESASSVSLAGDLSVGGGLTTGQPVTHSTDITSEFTVPSGEGIVLAGPISGESNITGSGNVAVVDPDSDSITTESDVLNAVNTDSTHSADAYHSHTDLVDISSDAHHSKTTSASALTDVSADSVSDAHHSKTTSASELTDVSADSASDAHHSRYSDSEAQAAADGSIDAESVDGYDIQKNGTDGQGIINFKT